MTIQTNQDKQGNLTYVIPVSLILEKTLGNGRVYQEFQGEDGQIVPRIPDIDGDGPIVHRSVNGRQYCSDKSRVSLYVLGRENDQKVEAEEPKYFGHAFRD